MAAIVPGASEPDHPAQKQLVRGVLRTAAFVGGFVAFVAVGSQIVG